MLNFRSSNSNTDEFKKLYIYIYIYIYVCIIERAKGAYKNNLKNNVVILLGSPAWNDLILLDYYN